MIPEIDLTRVVPSSYVRLLGSAPMYNDSECSAPDKLFANRFYDECSPLTPSALGLLVQELVRGKDFIDVGCGKGDIIRNLAKMYGARSYIGVDSEDYFNHSNELKTFVNISSEINRLREEGCVKVIKREIDNEFKSTWVVDDLLYFVSKMKCSEGTVFFASGLQITDWMRREAVVFPVWESYFDALYDELARVSVVGDAVIINCCQDLNGAKLLERGFRQDNLVEKKSLEIFVRI